MNLARLTRFYTETNLLLFCLERLSQEYNVSGADAVKHSEAIGFGEQINFFGHIIQFWDQYASFSRYVRNVSSIEGEHLETHIK